MFAVGDLVKGYTRAQVQAWLLNALDLIGANTSSWKSGAVVRTIIVALATVIAPFSALLAAIAKTGFLELAEDDWLDLVAWYVYRVERDTGSFASGYVTLTNSGAGTYDIDAEECLVRNSTTGKQYRINSAFLLSPGSSLTLAITAIEKGSDSTSAAGEIDELVSGLAGVTASNALAVVGSDPETDASVRTRCLAKLGSFSPNGPWDAYDYVCRSAKNSAGAAIGVTRTSYSADGFGGLTVYVATGSGGVTGTAGDDSTDLGALQEQVALQAAPLGISANVATATAQAIDVTGTIYCYESANMTSAQLIAAATARLADFVASQPIGGNIAPGSSTGYVYQDAVRTTIGATLEQVYHVVLTSPAADVSVSANSAPVLGTVSLTVVWTKDR